MDQPLAQLLAGDRSRFDIVPLGINCTISHSLRAAGLRATAFPFDWNVTPVRSAIELIGNGFSDFLADANLIFLPPVHRLLFDENGIEVEIKNDVITPVVCRRYRMLFPHDFSREGEACLGAVRQKYQRRVARFTELLSSNRYLIFIHHDEPLNQWQKEQYRSALGEPLVNDHAGWTNALAAVLATRYPRLNFLACSLPYFTAELERAWGRRAA
jgi:hypothetical protein